MPGAVLPTADGVADWIDNTHNWRAADADFLQERSVLRFTSKTARDSTLGPSTTVPAPQPGQVAYSASGEYLSYADSVGTWRDLVTFQNLTMTDTTSSIGFRHVLDSTDTLVIERNKASLGPGGKLVVDNTAVKVKTGATEAQLTTNATSLVSNVDIDAPSITTGDLTSTGIDNSGGTMLTASIDASGLVQAGTLLVSGSTTLQATTTATTINASGDITSSTSMTATTSVRGGNVLISGSTVASYSDSDSYLTFGSGLSTLGADTIRLTPTSQTTAVRFKSGTIDIPMATVVVSSTDPGVANYPDGTFWVTP